MKKTLSFALIASALMMACSNNDATTWTVSNLQVVGTDECEINDPADPLSGNFNITIDGNTFTMAHAELTIEASGDRSSDQADDVTLTNSTENSDYADCTAKLEDTFVVSATDGDLRIENNDTLTVVWNHTETDVSNTADACAGDWFVDLPCSSQLTFDLTKAE